MRVHMPREDSCGVVVGCGPDYVTHVGSGLINIQQQYQQQISFSRNIGKLVMIILCDSVTLWLYIIRERQEIFRWSSFRRMSFCISWVEYPDLGQYRGMQLLSLYTVESRTKRLLSSIHFTDSKVILETNKQNSY